MDIWQILGIDQTTDESDIRKAYARKLKAFKDGSPSVEEFSQLRDAYELAMAYGQDHDTYLDDGVPFDVDEDTDEVDVQLAEHDRDAVFESKQWSASYRNRPSIDDEPNHWSLNRERLSVLLETLGTCQAHQVKDHLKQYFQNPDTLGFENRQHIEETLFLASLDDDIPVPQCYEVAQYFNWNAQSEDWEEICDSEAKAFLAASWWYQVKKNQKLESPPHRSVPYFRQIEKFILCKHGFIYAIPIMVTGAYQRYVSTYFPDLASDEYPKFSSMLQEIQRYNFLANVPYLLHRNLFFLCLTWPIAYVLLKLKLASNALAAALGFAYCVSFTAIAFILMVYGMCVLAFFIENRFKSDFLRKLLLGLSFMALAGLLLTVGAALFNTLMQLSPKV